MAFLTCTSCNRQSLTLTQQSLELGVRSDHRPGSRQICGLSGFGASPDLRLPLGLLQVPSCAPQLRCHRMNKVTNTHAGCMAGPCQAGCVLAKYSHSRGGSDGGPHSLRIAAAAPFLSFSLKLHHAQGAGRKSQLPEFAQLPPTSLAPCAVRPDSQLRNGH